MGALLCPETVSAKRKTVFRELVQGQKCATQLKFLLQKPSGVDGSPSADELLAKILRSFSHTLSVLSSFEARDAVPQNLVISGENVSPVVAASSHDRRSEGSTKSRMGSSPPPKNRRGCYKRRKTAQTWTLVSNTPDDNHAWRKYGQKEILNSKFPRSYFRCSRKYEQGCRASKQVQRRQENPEMYQITYIGFHTCKDILKAPRMVTHSGNWESFPANHPDSKLSNERPHPSEETPSNIADNLDPSLWSDLKVLELSKAEILPSNMASDTVYSCTGSMDFGVDSVHFGTDFHFHESDQLL